eukprot:g3158.t1
MFRAIVFLILLLHVVERVCGSECELPFDSGNLTAIAVRDATSFEVLEFDDETASAAVPWPSIDREAEIYLSKGLLKSEEARAMIDILDEVSFDEDADTVDEMSTFEFYIEKSGDQEHLKTIASKPDINAEIRARRKKARDRLKAIVDPVIQDRMIPLVSNIYSDKCRDGCRVCFSFVRRYLPFERRGHKDHLDIQALATVVVSLGGDYEGGLYARAGGSSKRLLVPLRTGDAAIHSSSLLHGVKVTGGSRYSWINWISSSQSCDPADSAHWHVDEAERGDPIAMFLHAKRMPLFAPGEMDDQITWIRKSAEAGFARAMNEYGYHLHEIGNLVGAEEWYRRAISLGEEDAAFNLGRMKLAQGLEAEAVHLFRQA